MDVSQDSRTGKNGWHGMMGQFRQSTFGRIGGYDDVNDADRLRRDPAMRWTTVTHTVNPHPVHVSQGFNVRIGGQNLRLEAIHLAGRACECASGRWRKALSE